MSVVRLYCKYAIQGDFIHQRLFQNPNFSVLLSFFFDFTQYKTYGKFQIFLFPSKCCKVTLFCFVLHFVLYVFVQLLPLPGLIFCVFLLFFYEQHFRFGFLHFRSGIYDDEACTSDYVNHAMLLVGYTRNSWILKNWWSHHWGDNGYMYLKRGNNRCGIANYAVYALI